MASTPRDPDLVERLRAMFRDRGWVIDMDDRPHQILDPFVELAAALDAAAAQPVGLDVERLARALHATCQDDCGDATGDPVPFRGPHRVGDRNWAGRVAAEYDALPLVKP